MIKQNENSQFSHSYCSMKLIFDILTPRPHFIIIQKEDYRKTTITENEIKHLIKLVKTFLNQKPQYDNNAILSFHQGKWYQQNHKYFHAHLCVPKTPYCKEAKEMITTKTSLNRWPNSDDYLKRLKENMLLSKIKYKEYQMDCISMSHLCFNDPVSFKVPLEQFNTEDFTLVFLASTPRIGVIAKRRNIELEVLYYFMQNFYLLARKKLTFINNVYRNFGAHLCLYLNGKKRNAFHISERMDKMLTNEISSLMSVNIVGYVQMDEQLYLRWLPSTFHGIWLNEFKKYQHFVHT